MFEKLIEGVVISDEPFSCLCFNKTSLNEIKRYIQNEPDKTEAGGLLIGYRRSNHFEITHITTPKLFDVRQKFLFERRDNTHIRILKKLKKTNKDISYLGEWHTHPEEIPSPSNIDLSQWQTCKNNSTNVLLFIIFGTKEPYIKSYF